MQAKSPDLVPCMIFPLWILNGQSDESTRGSFMGKNRRGPAIDDEESDVELQTSFEVMR